MASLARWERRALGAVAALAVLAAGFSLTWPFGYDHGIFAWMGRRIVQGGMPYRDAWDYKGPAPFVVYALVQRCIGQATWCVRLFDLAVLLACVTALHRGVRRLTGPRTALWTAVLFVLWYLGGTYYATAQPDGWAALLLIPACLPLFDPANRGSARHLVAAGLVLGFCSMDKHVFTALAVLPVVFVAGGSAGATVRRVAWILVGWLAVVVPTLLWLWNGRALPSYWEAHFASSAAVYAKTGGLQVDVRLRGLTEYLLQTPVVVVVIPAAILGASGLARRDRRAALGTLVWLAGAVGLVVFQGKFFAYQWLLAFPPLAILAAVGLHDALVERGADDASTVAPPRPGAGLALASVVVVAVHCATHPAYEVARGALYVAGVVDADRYADGFGVPGPDRRAANYLRDHTIAGATVAMWGMSADVLYLTGLDPPGRFCFFMPQVIGEGTPYRSRYRAELIESFDRRKPEYVLVDSRFQELLGAPSTLDTFPELAQRVAADYVEDARFGTVALHRRRADGPR